LNETFLYWYNTIGGLILVLAFTYLLARMKQNYDQAREGVED
jgi:hypothetical protein